MSSIVCLKLSYKVFRDDLSACVSPLYRDPAVVTREGLEYTCKRTTKKTLKVDYTNNVYALYFYCYFMLTITIPQGLYRLFVVLFQGFLQELQFSFELQSQALPFQPHLLSSSLRFPLNQSCW